MRAVLCQTLTGYENLELVDIPSPALTPGCVRIRIRAAGINFSDTLITQGKYQVKPDLPFSPGFEIAGEILEVADDVAGFKPEDRVLAVMDFGGFAEEAIVPATQVFKMPDGLDFEAAASFPVAYGTSHLALKLKANLQSGENLVVHGAAGGVGLTAVEIGKRMGARVIATAGGPDKLEIARAHGADDLIDYRTEDVRERVKALTGGVGADVIYDPVGGDIFKASMRAIAPGGRILVVGFASGDVPQIPANILLVKNISTIGLNWGAYKTLDPQMMKDSMTELMDWFAEGSLKPHISLTYPLEDFSKALDALKQRKSTGKIILKI